jgi:molybdate transport system ATP-binding protein
LALDVERTVALVGPSGAGKSTILRVIAGLARRLGARGAGPGTSGSTWRGESTTKPDERRVGLFQEYALFRISARANVANGRKGAPAGCSSGSHLARTRPGELSGASGGASPWRCIARDQRAALDEPLAALDAHTKADVRVEPGSSCASSSCRR